MSTIRHGDYATERDDNFEWIHRFPLDGPFTFKTNTVQQLYDWWYSFSPARPRREHFDLSQHVSVAPYLFLIKVLGNGAFEYRLNGEKVIEQIGLSMKGVVISVEDEIPSHRSLALYCQEIVDGGTCKRCSGEIRTEELEKRGFESVDCPLVDADGNVTYCIGAITTFPLEEE